MLRKLVKNLLRRAGYDLVRFHQSYPVLRPMDPLNVEILADPAFQQSCREVADLTLLDTPRLANLWMLSRMTDPAGAVMEIGAYRGGAALHLSNACPGRKIIVCDPFSQESFEKLDAQLDGIFQRGQFAGNSEARLREAFKQKGCDALVIKGYFPESVRNMRLPPVSFVHLDVDVYDATRNSLACLLQNGMLAARSAIVLDDYDRRAAGVNKALAEALSAHPEWVAFGVFPSQALLVSRGWFDGPPGK